MRLTVDSQEEEGVLDLLLGRAVSRLEGQLRDSDAFDVKALGVLAADAAAIAVLVAVHDSINHLWWIPAITLGSAGAFLLAIVWPRSYDVGPDIGSFYEQFGALSAPDAKRQMLADLLQAIDQNDSQRPKDLLFKTAHVFVAVGLIGALIVSLIR